MSKKSDKETYFDREPDCRYRNQHGGDWTKGFVRSINGDGSVEMTCEYTGATRTIFPDRVEYKTRGPRGGTVWVSAERAEWPIDSGTTV